MKDLKIVNVYVEKNILIRLTNNKENADYSIVSGKKEVIFVCEDKDLINEYLLKNGVSPSASGFKYLAIAIKTVSNKLEKRQKYSLEKDVYIPVAEKFSVTKCSVERAISNAINRSKSKDLTPKRFIERYKLGF